MLGELAVPHLPLGIFRLEFRSDSALQPNGFAGSAWRGALGHALKRAACITQERECSACLLYRSCAYPYFYRTPPPLGAEKMRCYDAAPHPFVLRPEVSPHRPEECDLYLTLFGRANQHLSLLLYALMRAAAGPKGIQARRFDLVRVWQERVPATGDWRAIFKAGGRLEPVAPQNLAAPPAPSDIAIVFHTPLRVKRDGRHVGARDLRFGDLFSNLLRRVSMLTYFHTETPLETDFRRLVDTAKTVEARTDLRWVELRRYSSRQKTSMQLGGVTGRMEIRGQDLSHFWPYLWLGQWTHAGAAATMGLGRYTVASLQAGTCAEPAAIVESNGTAMPA
jgi:hypothetical protein